MIGTPLDGLRVVDFTQVLSGPYCTMLLADLGADVVKVEPPDGDPARQWGPFTADDHRHEFGGYFASINRNKRSLCVDLKSAGGRQVIMALLATADVLIENFRVGVMDRLGFSYEELHARFPRLVYASIRGFGDPRTGASPYADWPSYDIVAQAMGGLMGITGPEGGEPTKAGPGIGDIYPATLAAVGVLAAVHRAAAAGEGSFVDVAMYDGVLALCERIVYQASYLGTNPGPQGNSHPFLCPYGLFRTADGWVAIAAPTDRHWRELTRVMGTGDLGTDPRYARNADRAGRSPDVQELVERWTTGRGSAEVIAALGGVVPCGPVQHARDILADPHVAARDMIRPVDHPGAADPVLVAGTPIKFAGAEPRALRRAPLLGEHGPALCAEMGMDPGAVGRLLQEAAVICRGPTSPEPERDRART